MIEFIGVVSSSTTDNINVRNKLLYMNHLVLPRLVVKCKHNSFVFDPGPFLVGMEVGN